MVEIAEKLVEAVDSRQELVAVTEMVLAELAGRIAKRFEQFREGGVTWLYADCRTGDADFRETSAQRRLTRDEGRPASGAALVCVVVGKHHAFAGDAVDVGRPVS